MNISVNGLNHIKNWEGCELEAYYCPNNKLTIGYGHTGPDVKKGMVITLAKADQLLKADVAKAENAVNKLVKVPLNQSQFDALVSFTFNVGVGDASNGFMGSTLLRLLNERLYNEVPAQMRRWVLDDNKKPIQGLVNRRQDEIDLWNNSVVVSATPAKPTSSSQPPSLNARIKAQLAIIHAAEAEINRLVG